MPPETTEQPEAATTNDVADEPRDEQSRQEPARAKPDYAGPAPKPAGPGFFGIYKKSQGYWTRMGTAFGAALLGGLTAYNVYVFLPVLAHLNKTPQEQVRGRQIAMLAAAGFFAPFAIVTWRL